MKMMTIMSMMTKIKMSEETPDYTLQQKKTWLSLIWASIIINQHQHQSASIRVNQHQSTSICINQRGQIFSPLCFLKTSLRDVPQDQIVCFFEHCSNGLWPPPPPLVLNIYVADFSKGLLKRCVNACRDKCVKIVRKSLGKNVQYTKKLWQFYL